MWHTHETTLISLEKQTNKQDNNKAVTNFRHFSFLQGLSNSKAWSFWTTRLSCARNIEKKKSMRDFASIFPKFFQPFLFWHSFKAWSFWITCLFCSRNEKKKVRVTLHQYSQFFFGLSYFDVALATLKHDHSGLFAYPVQEMRRKKYTRLYINITKLYLAFLILMWL